MNKANRFKEAKDFYPFVKWSEYTQYGSEQYTDENLAEAKEIFDNLILELTNLNDDVTDEVKIQSFEKAVNAFNLLNLSTGETLIESAERDDLCKVFNLIATEANININQFEDNDITFQWRDW